MYKSLKKVGVFPEHTAANYISQLALALVHVHKKKIIHRYGMLDRFLMLFSTDSLHSLLDPKAHTVCLTFRTVQGYQARKLINRSGWPDPSV